MISMKNTVAALALSALAAPAFAGGFAKPEPTPFVPAPAPVIVDAAPIYDFSGPSVGVRLGYGQLNVDTDDDSDDEFADRGAVYGVTANYNYDLGSVIVGGGIDYDRTNIDTADGAVDLAAVARLKGRVGFDSGRNMYYATGGYAKAFTDGGDIGDSDGYFVGAGYEVFLTQNLTAGAEVLYHEFDDFNGSNGDGIDANATTATLSLNLKF